MHIGTQGNRIILKNTKTLNLNSNNNLIINSYMLFIKGIQSKPCMRDNIIAIF